MKKYFINIEDISKMSIEMNLSYNYNYLLIILRNNTHVHIPFNTKQSPSLITYDNGIAGIFYAIDEVVFTRQANVR